MFTAGLEFEPRQSDSRAFQSASSSQISSIFITQMRVRCVESQTYGIKICILIRSPGNSYTLHCAVPCYAKSLQWCPTLCNPMDCSPPGSSVCGVFQARILEWGCCVLLQSHTALYIAIRITAPKPIFCHSIIWFAISITLKAR